GLMLAEKNIESRMQLKDIVAGHDDKLFLLRVRGDSMLERGINPGDLVLIRQQPTVESGEIAAVLIGNEATLKVFRAKEKKIYLEPANKKYKPIYLDKYDDVRILGKAVMALRFLGKRRTLLYMGKEHRSLSEGSQVRGKILALSASNSGN